MNNINDYYQPGFMPSFPWEMFVALGVIFAIAFITGAIYGKQEHRHEVAENMMQTIAVVVSMIFLISACYYDGAVQLATNICRANTDTNIWYIYVLVALICGGYAVLVGALYLKIKKTAFAFVSRRKM